MKAPAIPYNPASDGIRAKIWECLRHNDRFVRLVHCADKQDKRSIGMVAAYRRKLSNCPLEQLIFVLLTVPRNLRGLEHKTWRELPEDVREAIDAAAVHKPLSPLKLKAPEIGSLASASTEAQRRRWVAKLENFIHVWDDYHVIAIPKRTRDPDQRKRIRSQLDKIVERISKMSVSSPKALRDDIPGGGGLLGTKKNWEVWHFVRHFADGNPELRERAKTLAAVWLSDRVQFDSKPQRYFQTGPGKVEAYDIYTRRRMDVEAHLRPIDNAIERIFPRFDIWV